METKRTSRTRLGRALPVLALTVAVALVSATTAVWAAHSFDDVPNTHPFHDEIAAVSDACIAGGFPDGTYRPGDPVTRQAMAAFLSRTGSRVEQDRQGGGTVNIGTAASLAFSPRITLAEVSIDAPALAGCDQWILLQGQASLYTNSTAAATCHAAGTGCNGHLWLEHNGDDIGSGFIRLGVDRTGGTVSVQGLVQVPGGSGAHDFEVTTSGFNVQSGVGLVSGGSLSATVIPFPG